MVSRRWICCALVAACTPGTPASRYERARVTDELALNFLGGNRAWKAGEQVSHFSVTMSCPQPED